MNSAQDGIESGVIGIAAVILYVETGCHVAVHCLKRGEKRNRLPTSAIPFWAMDSSSML